MRRLLRLGLLGFALLALGLSGLYLVRLGALRSRVLAEFESLAHNAYFHVVCEPFRVRVGTDARATGVASRLARAGYRRVQRHPRPGEFRVGGPGILFRKLSGASPRDERLVTLELEGPVVSRIEVGGDAYEWVELPPEHLTSFRLAVRERRVPVRFDEIPPELVRAALAAEDRRFFRHHGLDGRGIGRAFLHNLRRGRVVEGGSTVTQQVIKQILRRQGRSLHAKVDEAVLALAIERRFGKRQILQVYLNEVYLGQEGPFEIHGVAEGARFFFSKTLAELTDQECIDLAAAIRAPNAASPLRNPEKLVPYANAIAAALHLVAQPAAGDEAVGPQRPGTPEPASPVALAAHTSERMDFEQAQMGYYFDLFEREWTKLRKKHRITAPATLVAGVDPLFQLRAAHALRRGLADARGRSPRSDEAPLQGAVVTMDPETGALRAVVGGSDYAEAPFNRAADTARPVGSTFKPIVYLAALGGLEHEPRITQSTWLPDELREYRVGRQAWRPANFDGTYRGWVTARQALGKSINAATVALGMDVGVEEVARLAEEMGLQERVRANPSILLGAVDTSPVRLAAAYAALANGGRRVLPHALVEVRQSGRTMRLGLDRSRRVLDPAVAYIVTDMLVGAMRSGTGASAARYGFEHLATGKTGTTDGTRDAWFVGYTPELVATVWIGHDNNAQTGLTGARAALPVWARLMRGWLGEGWDLDFEPPPGITFRKIDPQTGELANSTCPQGEVAAYLEDTAPRRSCSAHSGTWRDRWEHRNGRKDEDARRDRWLQLRKKRGFWARLKDALGV